MIASFTQWLWDTLKAFFVWLVEQLWLLVQWLFLQFQAMGQAVLDNTVAAWVALFPGVDWQPVADGLAWGNYFLPLGEAVTVVGLLLTLWVATFLYKLVKSWIPTIGT